MALANCRAAKVIQGATLIGGKLKIKPTPSDF
jgi:hypothetical protein